MIVLRQKEFISTKLKFLAKTERAKRQTGFLGKLLGLGVKNGTKTVTQAAAHPVDTAYAVGDGILADNVQVVDYVTKAGKSILGPKSSGKTRAKEFLDVASDFYPTTAQAKAAVEKANLIKNKDGVDFANSLTQWATNPVKKTGEEAGWVRVIGMGTPKVKAAVGGKWTKGGVNNVCFGTAPDRVAHYVGENYAKNNAATINKEAEELMKSKEMRWFMREYNKAFKSGKKIDNAKIDAAIKSHTPSPKGSASNTRESLENLKNTVGMK